MLILASGESVDVEADDPKKKCSASPMGSFRLAESAGDEEQVVQEEVVVEVEVEALESVAAAVVAAAEVAAAAEFWPLVGLQGRKASEVASTPILNASILGELLKLLECAESRNCPIEDGDY
mmetsp:Transcript_26085/g.55445  ORF Transcript_26085/g.55445 Transcript_26085/m.55445 type:complete len:122 (-) Transcript_26085:78-443(-)